MSATNIRLFNVAAPLAALPLMDFQLDQIGPWLRGDEFRLLVSSLVTQILTGVADAFVIAIINALFGV